MMVIKFITIDVDNHAVILKETSTLTTVTPQIGWCILINQEQYFVDEIEMNYDNGIISVNLIK